MIPPETENGNLLTGLQRRTIRSFLRIRPIPKIFLLGNHSSFASLALEFSGKVFQEFHIDFAFSPGSPSNRGPPLFHSVISRAVKAETNLSMVVNAELALVNETLISQLLQEITRKYPSEGFLVTWPRYTVNQVPAGVLGESPAESEDRQLATDRLLSNHVEWFGQVETSGGAGAWLWDNRRHQELFYGAMPPFPSGTSESDTWLAHASLATTNRIVVEGGTAVTCVTLRIRASWGGKEGKVGEENVKEEILVGKRKAFGLVRSHRLRGMGEGKKRLEEEKGEEGKEEGKRRKDEVEKGSESRCQTRNPWMAKTCQVSKDVIGICLVEVACTCVSVFVSVPGDDIISSNASQNVTRTRQVEVRQKWLCDAVSPKPYLSTKEQTMAVSPEDGFTLKEILPFMADDRNLVVTVGVSGGYHDILMNFVCTLRRLGLRDPLVVAMDEDLYRFAKVQGLPVYLEKFQDMAGFESYENVTELSAEHKTGRCMYGSICFKRLTRLKSQVVYQIIKLGFHALWTDVDIVWFRDVSKELFELGPGTFPVQSDNINQSRPANSRGYSTRGVICAGFYLARSEPGVIHALEAIIKHAKVHGNELSEQPSFYQTLCGKKQENVVGDNECLFKGTRVIFMSQRLHPNGGIYKLWREKNATKACLEMGCASLHNNFIRGGEGKKKRLLRQRLWVWDERKRLCLYK